jgi:hypothetical protein
MPTLRRPALGGVMNIPNDTLVIGGAGLVLIAALWPTLRRTWRTRRWRSAAATILESWLDDGGGDPRDRRAKVCARYRYSAGGATFVGERLAFTSPVHRSAIGAERHLKQLSPGKRIEIWYDPANPSDAVIERAVSRTHYLVAAIALYFVLDALVNLAIALVVT